MKTIAIVGGGVSGILVAIHLVHSLRESPASAIHVFEQTHPLGLGVAYSTSCPEHLLNVTRERMSLFQSQPNHFMTWLHAKHHLERVGAFVPRFLYGNYISDTLAYAKNQCPENIHWHEHHDSVTALYPQSATTKIKIKTALSREVEADHVVLALGNTAPSSRLGRVELPLNSSRYIGNPWQPWQALDMSPDDTIFILGSGLTMVDIVLQLVASGHHGPIQVLSRHGLLPQPHVIGQFASNIAPVLDEDELPPKQLQALLRTIRQQVKQLNETQGLTWQGVLDTYRPYLPQIWQRLNLTEKRQFLTHLKPYWDVHRHRIAPDVHSKIVSLQQSGQLILNKGRVSQIENTENGFSIEFRTLENGTVMTRQAMSHWLINATGPSTDIRQNPSPLVQQLLLDGLLVPDELGLGIQATPDGAILDRQSQVVPNLYTLGPLLKAQLWETTAIPEIRIQAEKLAQRLAKELSRQYSA